MALADGLRSDIAVAVGRMQSTLGGKKEIRRLVEYLWEGEVVERMATGNYGRGQGLLVLTDRRLFFVRDGVMTKQTEDFPLDRVTSVAWNSSLAFGTVIVFTGGAKNAISSVHKADGRDLVDLVRARLTGHVQPSAPAEPSGVSRVSARQSPTELLRELGSLRDAGVLTHEEFETKKAELLRRL